jgi:hypothetical protein
MVVFRASGQLPTHEGARAHQANEREQQRDPNADEDNGIHDLAPWRFVDFAHR